MFTLSLAGSISAREAPLGAQVHATESTVAPAPSRSASQSVLLPRFSVVAPA